MTIKRDITTRSDVDILMIAFYEKAMADEVIGYFFTEVVPLDLERHLPIIGDFWETILFGSPAYRKHNRNPLLLHAEIDAKEHLRIEHFERWLALFRATVDECFIGPRAEMAKLRSRMIAQRMIEFVASSMASSRG